jgi:hypothetical protein
MRTIAGFGGLYFLCNVPLVSHAWRFNRLEAEAQSEEGDVNSDDVTYNDMATGGSRRSRHQNRGTSFSLWPLVQVRAVLEE